MAFFWCLSALAENFGFRIVYDSLSNLEAKLNSVLKNRVWCWRPARSEVLVDIRSRLPEVQIGEVDKPIWTIAQSGTFVSADTCDYSRKKKATVNWWPLVWHPHTILKHAFILWLAIQNRLTTGDRMLTWGFKGDINCVFYRNGTESRDHLFFLCGFSSWIWKTCMQRCNILDFPTNWIDLIEE